MGFRDRQEEGSLNYCSFLIGPIFHSICISAVSQSGPRRYLINLGKIDRIEGKKPAFNSLEMGFPSADVSPEFWKLLHHAESSPKPPGFHLSLQAEGDSP